MQSEPPRAGRSVEREVIGIDGAARTTTHDRIATEEPLELRLRAGTAARTLAITMRTPGNDFELAAGFAFGEGLVNEPDAVAAIAYCLDADLEPDQRYNVVTIDLARGELPAIEGFERHFTVSSACGVCGRAQLQNLRERVAPLDDDVVVTPETLRTLPETMHAAQRVFAATGGLHAAALFAPNGDLRVVREDVGRHNAVDKVVGWAFLGRMLPLSGSLLLVSGRAGYEILQKAAVGRIPIVCAISAPSSLAVDLAREFNITLIGFLRGPRANVYSAPQRVMRSSESAAAAR
jgi:FdhD protein